MSDEVGIKLTEHISFEDSKPHPRKHYAAPKLTEWGTIGELTQAGKTGGSLDGGTGQSNYAYAPIRRTPTLWRP